MQIFKTRLFERPPMSGLLSAEHHCVYSSEMGAEQKETQRPVFKALEYFE